MDQTLSKLSESKVSFRHADVDGLMVVPTLVVVQVPSRRVDAASSPASRVSCEPEVSDVITKPMVASA